MKRGQLNRRQSNKVSELTWESPIFLSEGMGRVYNFRSVSGHKGIYVYPTHFSVSKNKK